MVQDVCLLRKNIFDIAHQKKTVNLTSSEYNLYKSIAFNECKKYTFSEYINAIMHNV